MALPVNIVVGSPDHEKLHNDTNAAVNRLTALVQFYNVVTSSWPARPSINEPVTWYSTLSVNAVLPPMETGDIWISHPLSVVA